MFEWSDKLYEWSQNTKTEIKIRYFKLPFIGLHAKLTQNKVD